MRNPTRPEVVEAIFQGVKNVQYDYKRAYESHISNSEYSPEYLMNVYIFKSILEIKEKIGCPYGIAIEQPIRKIVEALPKIRGSYSKQIRKGGKCDLVLWDVNCEKKPISVIEVKENAWKFSSDVKRLARLIQRNLEYGILTSCKFEKFEGDGLVEAEKNLNEELRCIYKYIKKDVKRIGDNLEVKIELDTLEVMQLEGDEEKWVWCPVCYVIYDKNNQS